MNRTLSAALVAALLAGCGGPATQGNAVNPAVPKETVELSKQLGDLLAKVKPAAEGGDLSPLFAAGGDIPKNPKDYAKYSFGMGQLPKASGDDCQAEVNIGVPNMGDPFTAPWKFKRDGVEWKLVSAPLPAGSTLARKVSQERD